jgi:outer membrane scaffolding protein for murein synthesis (MipA/OmpV family)
MQHRRPAAWPALCLLLCRGALAADEPAPAEAPAPPPGHAPAPTAPAEGDWKWEGAVGPLIGYSPDYSGASTRKVGVTPGYYIRYGRISLSNVGAFVTRRRNDDIFQGLGLDLKRDDRLRLNVALRIDNGRKSNDIHGLQGVDDIERTLRARFSATVQLDPAWKIGTGLNADLLGHGGGNIFDFGIAHDRLWSPLTTWNLSAGVSAGDRRYMQSWYGVSERASAATGHPVYSPGAGLRDITFGTSFRTEFGGTRWIGLWGGSVGRLLGPAASSPLTTSPRQWNVNAGLAWRF